MKPLRVAFDAWPLSSWGPLFHVLRLEQPDMSLEWRRMGFPTRARSLLQSADVGLFVEPPREPGLSALTIETGEMLILMAVGHRLAQNHGLRVAEVLDQPFPRCPRLHPQWLAFWTLDAQRRGPPSWTADRVENPEQGLTVVASGRAIATIPAAVAGGLPHPGVVAISLQDGPPVTTRLVWRSDDENPSVHSLIELAAAMTCKSDAMGRGSAESEGSVSVRASPMRAWEPASASARWPGAPRPGPTGSRPTA